MFNLQHAVIHSFTKHQNETGIRDQVIKDQLLDVNLEVVISLVSQINSLLGKPGNNVAWGQFAEDGREGRFPSAATDFGASDHASDAFLELSVLVMQELMAQAAEEPWATGSNILVAQYSSSGTQFLLITSIKQRDGIRLSDDLVPMEVSEIDLSKIHQAAKINLDRLAETSEENPEASNDVEPDRTYLSFISKGDKAASDYFIVALGCTKGIASARATLNAIDLVESFFRERQELRSQRQVARDNVVSYLKRQLEAKEPATLENICNSAIQALPGELVDRVDDLRGELNEHLNGEQHKIPGEFTVNSNALNKRTRIKGKAGLWDVQFDRNALGTTADSEVWYDGQNQRLVLTNIPQNLIAQIRKELARRE